MDVARMAVVDIEDIGLVGGGKMFNLVEMEEVDGEPKVGILKTCYDDDSSGMVVGGCRVGAGRGGAGMGLGYDDDNSGMVVGGMWVSCGGRVGQSGDGVGVGWVAEAAHFDAACFFASNLVFV
ncbi:hypothetical protein L6452_27140 [Arctium lappa]|uniref:Uncharacterized protein n=1 Tax=Arctium lappa TaxID=4217 RepID=A0ACB8ZWD2_ARCLA|nr:hypothetical protein L6452_27140 [Arctium lappa]